MQTLPLIIVGAGGAGRETAWVAHRSGCWKVVGFVDDSKSLGTDVVDGLRVVGTVNDLLVKTGDRPHVHVAIGYNETRRSVSEALLAAGYALGTVIDPSATVADSAQIGAGTYVAQFVVVGPSVQVGRSVILNVHCNVGHDAKAGDYCQICPGARVTGGATVGEGAFIGSNAVIVPGGSVGAWASLAAASLAANEIPASASAIGVPATILRPPSRAAGIPIKPPQFEPGLGIGAERSGAVDPARITKREFYRHLDELLELRAGTIQGTEHLADLGKWDSLAIMGFIALLDRCFDRQVPAEKILACATVADLVALAAPYAD